MATVAVYSTADQTALHVRLADEAVCIGPAAARDSYLNIDALLVACVITGADALHPGYGFLAENAQLADALLDHKITFIGPKPEHIRLMGDKIAAKRTAVQLGLICVPGSDGPVTTAEMASQVAAGIGYPVLVKASAGGGGRGMMVAPDPESLPQALSHARATAGATFGDDTVYLEKYLVDPRHIEIQVLGDTHGNAIHLGERDCSLQRRHQKIWEEAPSWLLSAVERDAIGSKVAHAMRQLGYVGAGTVEFLFKDGQFYFIEMNTRIQVEHPVTEMITGVDLVKEQIRIASGSPLMHAQEDIRFQGHAIECRINAENATTFQPSPGRISSFVAPSGPGVRIDTAAYTGYTVPPDYDSLIGKLIVHGRDRGEALVRLRRALEELSIEGIATTAPLFAALLRNPDIQSGDYHIHWLEKYLQTGAAEGKKGWN